MSKWVVTDTHGLPTAFYDSALNTTIPVGAQAITNAQYDTLIANPGTTTFIGGVIGSYAAAAPPPPSAPVQAQMALGAGLAIVSTGSAGALNGTYGLDTTSMSLMRDLAALIAGNGGNFPGAAATWEWPDVGGTLHSFATGTSFTAFANSMADYRLALFGVIWGSATTLPTARATIP